MKTEFFNSSFVLRGKRAQKATFAKGMNYFCLNILPMPGLLRVKLNDLERIVLIFPGFLETCRKLGHCFLHIVQQSRGDFKRARQKCCGNGFLYLKWLSRALRAFFFTARCNYPMQQRTDSGWSLTEDAKK